MRRSDGTWSCLKNFLQLPSDPTTTLLYSCDDLSSFCMRCLTIAGKSVPCWCAVVPALFLSSHVSYLTYFTPGQVRRSGRSSPFFTLPLLLSLRPVLHGLFKTCPQYVLRIFRCISVSSIWVLKKVLPIKAEACIHRDSQHSRNQTFHNGSKPSPSALRSD